MMVNWHTAARRRGGAYLCSIRNGAAGRQLTLTGIEATACHISLGGNRCVF